jgi:hypothetical protein
MLRGRSILGYSDGNVIGEVDSGQIGRRPMGRLSTFWSQNPLNHRLFNRILGNKKAALAASDDEKHLGARGLFGES